MGSRGGSSAPWQPPFYTYTDCSLGVCSIYCPQWCYMVYPPPSDSGGSTRTNKLSPFIIAVIGILSAALLLVAYYIFFIRFCRRRRGFRDRETAVGVLPMDTRANGASGWQPIINGRVREAGLEESVVKSIAVYKFRRGEGVVDGMDCSVCLSEFEEEESLRLLPKCNHAFHLPCIDTWFKSHSSCPLCRSDVKLAGAAAALLPPLPSPPAAPHRGSAAALETSSHDPGRPRPTGAHEAVVGGLCGSWHGQGAPPEVMRRSASLNAWLCGGYGGGASTSDHPSQTDDGNVRFSVVIGPPNGAAADGPHGVKRSASMGRYPLGSNSPGRSLA
ncbi:hypothetical protein SAY87_014598 [Trapa incisa]|uniref:RING-type E3 ubiquitin transferase n=1 Tax=Trapa incisa TaxID=236973 RepID=A0AAN7JKK6_9MYRT|nr:hypothetical protein SAY87_014598 [Trapa incisa]